ncbi:antifreeze protein Maxi-like [Varroa jacobsoni]|uniref:antifreeze protein Maxi-like n=1 Tax=Varroa jacobsoni TaxID=62625 RepID=UPI000BF4BEC2|nr:antifreeze protein Maxi-like [Varroa jacobsoni]
MATETRELSVLALLLLFLVWHGAAAAPYQLAAPAAAMTAYSARVLATIAAAGEGWKDEVSTAIATAASVAVAAELPLRSIAREKQAAVTANQRSEARGVATAAAAAAAVTAAAAAVDALKLGGDRMAAAAP